MTIPRRKIAVWMVCLNNATAFVHTGKCSLPRKPASCASSSSSFGISTPSASCSSSDPNSFIRLRNATIQDLEFMQFWEQQPHLKDPDVMGDEEYNGWNWEQELPRDHVSWRHQLIAEDCRNHSNDDMTDAAVPFGFVQVIDPALEESHYWGEDCPANLRAIDIWIGNVDYLGKGCGTAMMRLALENYCFSDPSVEAVVIDPMANNVRAHRFYQRLGFVPEGIRFFGVDKCLVHRLSREDYEKNKS